jgi:uroporphyrin-III C-methyltransferase
VPHSAQVHNVGKRCGRKSTSQTEINALLVQYALLGFQVVRLKGGDPFIFGRGGEEIEALREANIDFEIIPGVTAALGAAAAAQIPLTHRGISPALIVLAGYHANATSPADWPSSIPANATVVVYMPGYEYEATAQQLHAKGLPGATPCAILSRATSRDEQIHLTTLDGLPSAPRLAAPTLLIVGEVVLLAKPAVLHRQFHWHDNQSQSEKSPPFSTEMQLFIHSLAQPMLEERPE